MTLGQWHGLIGAPLAQAVCADDQLRLKGKALAQTARQSASPIGAPLAHSLNEAKRVQERWTKTVTLASLHDQHPMVSRVPLGTV